MLNGINLIRALSCLAIAIFHICKHVTANYDGVALTFNLAAPGFHLFLLISGFILVYITHPSDKPHRFMLKRVVRIAPLYWIMTALAIALVLIRPWMLPGADLSTSSIMSSYFFLPHVDQLNQYHPILFVGWTLNYIMLFYALFAIALLAPPRLQILAAVSGLLAVMAVATILPKSPATDFYGDPILLEFAAGCFVGHLLKTPRVTRWIKRTPMWPLALLGIAGLSIAMSLETSGFTKVLVYAPPAAVLVFAAAGQDMYRKPLTNRLLQRLGLLSFGVFLVHPLVIPILGSVVHKYVDTGWIGATLLFPIVLVMTIILADLAYRVIEQPSNKWLRRKLHLSSARQIPKAMTAQL